MKTFVKVWKFLSMFVLLTLIVLIVAFFLHKLFPISGKHCLLAASVVVPSLVWGCFIRANSEFWAKTIFYATLLMSTLFSFASWTLAVTDGGSWGAYFLIAPVLFMVISDASLLWKRHVEP